MFPLHIGLADFLGFTILNLNILGFFFFRKYYFFRGGGAILWILMWVTSELDNFMGYFFKLSAPICVL